MNTNNYTTITINKELASKIEFLSSSMGISKSKVVSSLVESALDKEKRYKTYGDFYDAELKQFELPKDKQIKSNIKITDIDFSEAFDEEYL